MKVVNPGKPETATSTEAFPTKPSERIAKPPSKSLSVKVTPAAATVAPPFSTPNRRSSPSRVKVKLPVRSAVKPPRFTPIVVLAVVTLTVDVPVFTVKVADEESVTPVRPVSPRLTTETEAATPELEMSKSASTPVAVSLMPVPKVRVPFSKLRRRT